MHQEKYSLTWHSYSDHLKSMMKELMMNEDFSDVTLVTEDKKQIKANISILSACSPIFREVLKKEKNSSTIMFLRGIQYSEIESILQFIYLGEATFYEERMDEFLAVAKSLEIKELCNAETNGELLATDSKTKNESLKEHLKVPNNFKKKPRGRRRQIVSVNGKYKCEPCQKTFYNRPTLNRHIKSKHDGVKYDCDQCDFRAGHQSSLALHILSKHDGVKYACGQCDSQFTQQGTLKTHIQSKHEGVKYVCDQCDHQATTQSNLTVHVKSKHDGFKYSCHQCDYQFTQHSNLIKHMKNKHNDEHCSQY